MLAKFMGAFDPSADADVNSLISKTETELFQEFFDSDLMEHMEHITDQNLKLTKVKSTFST